jgi:hypothetical protein
MEFERISLFQYLWSIPCPFPGFLVYPLDSWGIHKELVGECNDLLSSFPPYLQEGGGMTEIGNNGGATLQQSAGFLTITRVIRVEPQTLELQKFHGII